MERLSGDPLPVQCAWGLINIHKSTGNWLLKSSNSWKK